MSDEPKRPWEPDDFARAINEAATRVHRRVMRHRDRYVKAWVAATGIDPRDAMIVERRMNDGSVQITVERREAMSNEEELRS